MFFVVLYVFFGVMICFCMYVCMYVCGEQTPEGCRGMPLGVVSVGFEEAVEASRRFIVFHPGWLHSSSTGLN